MEKLNEFLTEQIQKLNAAAPKKSNTLFSVVLDLCKHEEWRNFIFEKEDKEIDFFKQNVKFSFDIFEDEFCIVGMKFNYEEVDLSADEYDEATTMINKYFKEEVEKMMEQDEEDFPEDFTREQMRKYRINQAFKAGEENNYFL